MRFILTAIYVSMVIAGLGAMFAPDDLSPRRTTVIAGVALMLAAGRIVVDIWEIFR